MRTISALIGTTTSRREVLAGLAGVSVAAGVVVAAVASPQPDEALYEAIAAYRGAVQAERRAIKAASEVEDQVVDSIEHPGIWEKWRVAHHPTGNFFEAIRDNPDLLQAGRLVDLSASSWPRLPDGSLNTDDPASVRIINMLARTDEQAYYAPLKPIYDAQVERYFERRAEAEEVAGLPELEAAADEASLRKEAAQAALLAIRPQTAAGFVAKVQALLTLADEASNAIGEGEVEALIADTAALLEGSAL